MRMRTISIIIGLLASIGSMVLWDILAFYNPYAHQPVAKDVLLSTSLTLLAPAVLAFIASVIKKRFLMYLAFIWSLPSSFYAVMTPSIFILFGLTSLLYLAAGIMMIKKKDRMRRYY